VLMASFRGWMVSERGLARWPAMNAQPPDSWPSMQCTRKLLTWPG
jgi:hypothetical protein